MTDTTEVTTVDYVRASLAGDAIKAKEIFNQLMAPKVVDAVQQKKTEIAQDYFGQKPEVEPTAAEVTDDSEEEAVTDDEQVTDQEEETHEDA